MRRFPPPSILFAAAAGSSSTAAASAAAATAFMYTRPPYREGVGNQWRRAVSSSGEQSGGSSHPNANAIAKRGLRPRPRPQISNHNFNQRRPFPSSNPRHSDNYNHQNQQSPPPSSRQRPSDYRSWEYATALQSNTLPRERFMILSYNLLADYLAINHRSKLYFHIPPKFLDWEWRKRSILFELGLWSADIMCFQEVDRFQDLEEELMVRGYHGIWKMRTGNAVDGCAIFWRASRFKLLYEEWFEFNRLGLRDNVAQICVLELVSCKNITKTSALPPSSTASKKVVICNIHVLYNPRRGEMKLGQVRVLLNRAHAVSKIWNGAPVVLCGDFNCTPKSSLYNYIAEQKLDLTEVDRDNVSGQASAEISSPRSYSQNPRIQSTDKSSRATTMVEDKEVGTKQGGHYLNMQKQNYSDSSAGDVSFRNGISQFTCEKAVPDMSNDSFFDGHCRDERRTLCDEVTKETTSDRTDAGKDQTDPTDHVPVDKLMESQRKLINNGEFPVGAMTDASDDNTRPLAHPCFQSFVFPPNNNKNCDEAATPSVGYDDTTDVRTGPVLLNISNSDSSLSEQFHKNDERGNDSTSCKFSSVVANVSFTLEKQLENNDTAKADESSVENCHIFLSASHNSEEHFPSDFCKYATADLAESDHSKKFDSSSHILMSHVPAAVLDCFPRMDFAPDEVERSAYDPSKWTSMDLEIATGNADCPLVEHPLKLKSTYTETEDQSGARDSNGEPLVTSYNRCFSGTVDYVWRSEGLQTVRVLSPMRKDVMQWTRGFPTKKWGSDHIALVSELAFSEGVTENNTEIQ